MSTKDHVHSVIKATGSRYTCSDPECTWRDSKEYLIGKQSRCPYCGTIFILTKTNIRLAKPWCGMCNKKPLNTTDAFKLKAQEMMVDAIEDFKE